MRRPTRLRLAAAAAALPLALVSGCTVAGNDGGIRTENGSGIDDKSVPTGDEDSDQVDTDDQDQEG